MRDQRLFLIEFQLEFITQERRQLIFDGLGFGFWPGESQKVVVGIAGVAEPAVAGVARITPGQAAPLLPQFPGLCPVCAPSRPRQCVARLGVGRVLPAARPLGVLRDQDCLDVLVQLVQVNIRQDR